MTEEEFERRLMYLEDYSDKSEDIRRCLYSYFDTLYDVPDRSEEPTLKQEVESIIECIDHLGDYVHLKFPNGRLPSNDQEYLDFIESSYKGNMANDPSSCGFVAAILKKNGDLDGAARYLGIENINEPIRWRLDE